METTEKKIKRSVQKREKIKAIKEAARTGPAVAYLNNVPTSPRKMRLVADLIRGERVSNALNLLKYEAKHPAARLEKLLMSAISNWETKNKDVKLEEADLFVASVSFESPGGCKFTQLMSDHILRDINRNKLVAVVHSKSEPDQVWCDRASA